MRTYFLIALAAFVAACSTTPVSERDAQAVPSERVYARAFMGPAVSSTDGSIVFLRDEGFGGAGCTHDIYVDTVKVVGLRHGEQAMIHVPAGRHLLRMAVATSICPDITASQETDVVAGHKQVYRILLPADGGLRMTRIE